jgi:polysaccharide biosynthesis/export protein
MNALCKFVTLAALAVSALAAARADSSRITVYKIRTTDKLSIRVFQEDDLTTISRVDAKGTVNLPLVGEVRVSGQTLSQAEDTIERSYRDGRFLRNPEVTISVEEYAPREVSIQGQVKNPGRFPLPVESAMTVVDLVTRAGGFTDTAQGTAVRVTRVLPDGSTRVITLDVESLIKGRSSAKTNEDNNALLLEPDDIVYVPERII